MRKFVAGFMFSEDETEVLLIEKLKPAWQKGYLNAIGGKLEINEDSATAMQREFKEETGLQTKCSDWQHFVILQVSPEAQVDFYFTHSNALSAAKTMEVEKVVKCQVNNLPQNTMHNLRWLIPMALDKKLSFEQPILLVEKVES